MERPLIVRMNIYLLRLIIFLTCSSVSASAPTYFIGHLNPDTDSIVSSIAAAQFYGGVAARTGKLNKESQYLLEMTHFPVPIFINNFKGREIGLVDFNQTTQAPASLKSGNITMIIDHHALGDRPFIFARPIMITIKPWGSTATILADLFVRDKRLVSKELATLLLGAVISDTLGFYSPTTTDNDRELASVLQKTAGIDDLKAFAKEIFTAKSDIDSLSDQDILLGDYKIYNIKDIKIGIAVAESVTPDKIIKRKDNLLKIMGEQKAKDDLNFMYFFIIDINRGNSTIIILGKNEKLLAKNAFKVESKDHLMILPGLISRKLQFFPLIRDAL